jgi:hypothetical protein
MMYLEKASSHRLNDILGGPGNGYEAFILRYPGRRRTVHPKFCFCGTNFGYLIAGRYGLQSPPKVALKTTIMILGDTGLI